MKKHQWFIILGLLFLVGFNLGFAKDDRAKLERVEITVLDVDAMTLGVADMNFWVDAKTKIEDNSSNIISFSGLNVGDTIELWYDESKSNDTGFVYVTKIELEN